MSLWEHLAEESAGRCGTSASFDVKTVKARVRHEGESFLTITLPDFGKGFQKSLDLGQIDRRQFTSFRFGTKGSVGLPRFLGGFLGLVFDPASGVLLDDPSVDAIIAVRQLTLMFGKILLPCSDARVKSAIDGFVECEQDVRAHDAARTADMKSEFRQMSRLLWTRMFTQMDRKIYEGGHIVPKHGPGVTADKLLGNQKYLQTTWPARLEEYFPMGEFLLPNWSYYDQLKQVDILEPGSEIPVKVVTVPKTLKTPRVIAIEPTAMQYAQQGLLEMIRHHKEEIDPLHAMIGIDDQTPNQELARLGSQTGILATLDLSEASDRVSNQHVLLLTSDHLHLREAIQACRSRKADVPGHGVLRLAKFASMGSALTFPIEAMVFLTMIFVAIQRESSTPLTWRDVKRLSKVVRVYGDDIIVPVDMVSSVVSVLESFGIKVNTSKSYWNGKFRESCGREFFAGEDVSIVRVRELFPSQPTDVSRVISLVSLRNQLYLAGYWQTCKWLDERIRKVIRHFPVVSPSSRVLGRVSFLGYEIQKYHPTLHSPLVKGYVVDARIPKNSLGESGALLKFFLKRGSQPTVDREHLERSGRPHAVNIKLRWSQPF